MRGRQFRRFKVATSGSTPTRTLCRPRRPSVPRMIRYSVPLDPRPSSSARCRRVSMVRSPSLGTLCRTVGSSSSRRRFLNGRRILQARQSDRLHGYDAQRGAALFFGNIACRPAPHAHARHQSRRLSFAARRSVAFSGRRTGRPARADVTVVFQRDGRIDRSRGRAATRNEAGNPALIVHASAAGSVSESVKAFWPHAAAALIDPVPAAARNLRESRDFISLRTIVERDFSHAATVWGIGTFRSRPDTQIARGRRRPNGDARRHDRARPVAVATSLGHGDVALGRVPRSSRRQSVASVAPSQPRSGTRRIRGRFAGSKH